MANTNIDVDKENLELRMSRDFNAPRELLWRAHTEPELIPKWWARRQDTTVVEKMDVKNGGEWRYVSTDPKGQKDVFYGTYIDIKEPESVTWEFNYEPVGPGHEVVETFRLEEIGEGQTRITTHSKYKSLEDLEGMVDSGMEEGATETWDRLEELLEELKNR